MKRIELIKGGYALIDDKDFESVNKISWTRLKNGNIYYAYSYIDSILVGMHRFILDVTSPKIMVDHKDHDGLNNQRENIRICTLSENSKNVTTRKNSSSKYLGVSENKCVCKYITYNGEMKTYTYCRLRATIKVGNKTQHLGYFKTELECAIIYNIAARKYHGEFANPNKFSK